jgi:hypothetical protein
MKRSLGISLGVALAVAVALPAAAGNGGGIGNWAAPSSWTPPAAQTAGGRTALIATPQPLPFVPITPCRVADTRGNGFTGTYGPPSMAGGASRNFTISTQCGIPAGAVAVSFNFTVWNTLSYGDLKVYPTAGTVAAVSTLNWNPGVLALANAAVVPLGTSGQITTVNESGSPIDLFIDVNGYYTGTLSSSQTFFINNPSGYFGIYGVGGTYGVVGASAAGVGTFGGSTSGLGVKGHSSSNNGVWAESTSQDGLAAFGGRDGAYSQGARYGLAAASTGTSGMIYGVTASSASTSTGAAGGFFFDHTGGVANNLVGAFHGNTAGVVGSGRSGIGVLGVVDGGPWAAVAGAVMDSSSPYSELVSGNLGWTTTTAGYFKGNVQISSSSGAPGNLSVAGTLSKGSGTFKIDHPLDPENKYLYHSFVESPDMMNVYNGMVELGADGSAVVKLPAYFEALNSDFRYQLTAVGSRQPGLYVDQEVAGNEFVISGGKPYGKVSWQVTGIRRDPFANANRVIPEVEKEPAARGYYLHPAAFKQPAEKSLTEHLAAVEKAEAAEKAKAQKNDR